MTYSIWRSEGGGFFLDLEWPHLCGGEPLYFPIFLGIALFLFDLSPSKAAFLVDLCNAFLSRFEAYPNTPYTRVKLSFMSSFSSVCCLLYLLTTSLHPHSTSTIMYS